MIWSLSVFCHHHEFHLYLIVPHRLCISSTGFVTVPVAAITKKQNKNKLLYTALHHIKKPEVVVDVFGSVRHPSKHLKDTDWLKINFRCSEQDLEMANITRML